MVVVGFQNGTKRGNLGRCVENEDGEGQHTGETYRRMEGCLQKVELCWVLLLMRQRKEFVDIVAVIFTNH